MIATSNIFNEGFFADYLARKSEEAIANAVGEDNENSKKAAEQLSKTAIGKGMKQKVDNHLSNVDDAVKKAMN